ncbi:Signal recognition particle 19 kDa, partial [Musa troglodytarum]
YLIYLLTVVGGGFSTRVKRVRYGSNESGSEIATRPPFNRRGADGFPSLSCTNATAVSASPSPPAASSPETGSDSSSFLCWIDVCSISLLVESRMQVEAPNIKKWNVIYPVYINSKKTVTEGRRVSATKACENPTCIEIGDCCSYLKVPFAIELDKAYSRDFMQRGRVRVLLKREDGSLYNTDIGSKKQLMLRVAELIPKHHGRTKKQEPANTSTATTGPSKSGKGGKKKR